MAGDFFETKLNARQVLKARRRAFTSQQVRSKSEDASRRLLALPFFATARWVATYAPQSFELQPLGLKAPVALPRVAGAKGTPLVFHRWDGQELISGPLGLTQPGADWPVVALDEIDVFVVPAVGFAIDGARLGRGAGYYDATLKASRGVRVGFTFDDCVVDGLPTDPWDVPMDWVVTESRVLQPARSPKTQE